LRILAVPGNAVEVFIARVIPVVGELMTDVHGDQKNACNTERQPYDVDQGLQSILENVAKAGLEIVEQHRG
jgi:hypothetical protein